MPMSEAFIDFLASVYAGRKCSLFPGNPHREHCFPMSDLRHTKRITCEAWRQANEVLTTLSDKFEQQKAGTPDAQ